jgi:DNA polymerase-3 subunit alpha
MDRILSISSSNFQAADAGQITMFGDGTGLTEIINLSEAQIPINRRAQLDWERELIGLYVSDHPLSTVMDSLKQHVTHFAQDLNEAKHQERVCVAGIVTKIRHHQTKNGKAMAFASIEDTQGLIDLVIFPNTWKKFSELVQFDEIIYVKGKADANGGDTKVLVDQISTSLTHVEPLPEGSRQLPPAPEKEPQPAQVKPIEIPPAREKTPDPDFKPTNDFPFPAEDPPPDLSDEKIPSGEEDPLADQTVPAEEEQSISLPINELPITQEEEPIPVPEIEVKPAPEKVGNVTLDEDSTYLITIILKNRGDTMRDKLRLRQIYGTLISYPGQDRFAFQISENDQSHLLEFPNASTKISKNLINQLRDMLGRENVQVEKYLF